MGTTSQTGPRMATNVSGEPDSTADSIDRLMREHKDQFDPIDISRIVLSCREDLRGSPQTALPELIERLARQRLLELSTVSPSRRPPLASQDHP